MSDLELVVLVLVATWLGVLTLVTLLVVRQIGLITLRLDLAHQPGSLPADGLDIGTEIPAPVAEDLPELADGLGYVLLLSGNCGPCRDLVPRLGSIELRGPVFVLMPGEGGLVDDFVRMLPSGYRVVRDPLATEVATALQMERTPAVLELEDGVVTGKAHLFEAQDLQRLMDARDHSNAAEVAKMVKGAREHVLA